MEKLAVKFMSGTGVKTRIFESTDDIFLNLSRKDIERSMGIDLLYDGEVVGAIFKDWLLDVMDGKREE